MCEVMCLGGKGDLSIAGSLYAYMKSTSEVFWCLLLGTLESDRWSLPHSQHNTSRQVCSVSTLSGGSSKLGLESHIVNTCEVIWWATHSTSCPPVSMVHGVKSAQPTALAEPAARREKQTQ